MYRVRLHAESGREKRRVQLWCGAAGADSREEAGRGVWRWRGHSKMGEENHIRTLTAV